MRGKTAVCLLAGVICTSLLGGCDLKELKVLMPGGSQVSGEQEGQAEKEDIRIYEEKLSSGEASEADYITLANLYADENRIREQRDVLEQCRRLFSSEESFSQLQQLTVNAQEESEDIRSEFKRLADNLETEESLDEGVAMLVAPEWFPMVMPKLREGSRNYYWKSESGDTLFVQAGYNSDGQSFSKVWHIKGGNQLTFLHYEAGMIQSLKTTIDNGACDGGFDSWLCDQQSGTVLHENGTLKDGVCVGAYSAQAAFRDAGDDPYTFWQGREKLDLTSYKGDFGEDGVTTVSQPAGIKKNTVAYACNEKKTDYLYVKADSAKADTFVFRADVMGIENPPDFTEYEAAAASDASEETAGSVSISDIRVRIYDGEIQWYDGEKWHSEGSVSSYQAKDPFAAYAAGSGETGGDQKESSASPAAFRIGRGKVEVKKPKSNSSSGGSSSGGSGSSGNKSSSVGSGSSGNKSSSVGSGSSGNKSGSGGSNSSGNKSSSGGSGSSGKKSSSGKKNSSGKSNSSKGGGSTGGNSSGGSSGGQNSKDTDEPWTDDYL